MRTEKAKMYEVIMGILNARVVRTPEGVEGICTVGGSDISLVPTWMCPLEARDGNVGDFEIIVRFKPKMVMTKT